MGRVDMRRVVYTRRDVDDAGPFWLLIGPGGFLRALLEMFRTTAQVTHNFDLSIFLLFYQPCPFASSLSRLSISSIYGFIPLCNSPSQSISALRESHDDPCFSWLASPLVIRRLTTNVHSSLCYYSSCCPLPPTKRQLVSRKLPAAILGERVCKQPPLWALVAAP
jgi:hypothetical protein